MSRYTVLEYVEAINNHDIDKLYSLMGDKYIFIDTYANEVHGKDKMKESWIGYFEWFPDYHIEITDLLMDNDIIAIFGFASGTYRGDKSNGNKNHWRLPAAWKVIVERDKVKLWQVTCDSKIPFDIMNQ